MIVALAAISLDEDLSVFMCNVLLKKVMSHRARFPLVTLADEPASRGEALWLNSPKYAKSNG